jgi:hypothetical protein
MIDTVHKPDLRGHQGLMPLDYFLRGHTKDVVYQQKSQTRESYCIESWSLLTAYGETKLFERQQSILRRAELCMNSGGGHFEQYAVQHN